MISNCTLRWAVGGVIVLLGTAAPVRWVPKSGLIPAQACADGTCCPELKSHCITNNLVIPDYYLKAGDGPCGGSTRPLPPP